MCFCGGLIVAKDQICSQLLSYPPFLSGTEGEYKKRTGMGKFMGQDKNRKIIYHLLLWAK